MYYIFLVKKTKKGNVFKVFKVPKCTVMMECETPTAVIRIIRWRVRGTKLITVIYLLRSRDSSNGEVNIERLAIMLCQVCAYKGIY